MVLLFGVIISGGLSDFSRGRGLQKYKLFLLQEILVNLFRRHIHAFNQSLFID
jgi:hypothetical protein